MVAVQIVLMASVTKEEGVEVIEVVGCVVAGALA